ncbi:hypothetical protein A5767_07470 [Rhodococcus sp. 852002-51564_SCH6189132-a]|uniref:hypothetical protein n=1 Tax=Rhodococcus sp. 852002-51564_SCH6189132-a TaxID=1834103 RepID=UPI0007EB2DEC|nr:hypothetical protein [Rhodococcus sp. 852002-51564_SCH6189132-a]OBA37279.1 hypothetical protein A5767_07470 [Rhodococcus sp. 852002-51564_SCH6189132-a]
MTVVERDVLPSGAENRRFRDRRATYVPSRPLLEHHVRRRVRAIPNITLLDGHHAGGLTATPNRRRITGVQVGSRDGVRIMTADLVVDAMGRGARTPAGLEKLGYRRPVEEHVVVHVVYRSRLLRLAPGTPMEKMVLIGVVSGRPAGMALFGYKNDMWLFTVAAMAGREPPPSLTGMIFAVEAYAPDHVVAALRTAEPLGEDDLSRRFFRAAKKPIGAAWQFAIGSDLALPEVEGPRSVQTRLGNAYVARVLAAAENDPVVVDRFLRVSSLMDPPGHLMHPALVGRVCVGNLRRHRRIAGMPAGAADRRTTFVPAHRCRGRRPRRSHGRRPRRHRRHVLRPCGLRTARPALARRGTLDQSGRGTAGTADERIAELRALPIRDGDRLGTGAADG